MRGNNDTSLIKIQENTIQAFENLDLELQRLVRDTDVHALGHHQYIFAQTCGHRRHRPGMRGPEVHSTGKWEGQGRVSKVQKKEPR